MIFDVYDNKRYAIDTMRIIVDWGERTNATLVLELNLSLA